MSKQDVAESTTKGQQSLLEVINQHIGQIPVYEIKAMDVLKVCRLYKKDGKLKKLKWNVVRYYAMPFLLNCVNIMSLKT